MVLKLLQALDSAVLDVTDLVRVEFGPLPLVELLGEVEDEQRVHEVKERIAHIRLVLEVNWQVQKVVFADMSLVYFLK